MNKQGNRFVTIDLMRGFAMIIVIITHTTVYFLSTPGISPFWNYIHMSVAPLVFCSGYVLFAKYKEVNSIKAYGEFVKKRVFRLIQPFYVFLIFLFILESIQHHFKFTHISQGLLILYPDIAWLIILFIELTLLYPFFLFILQKKTFTILWLLFAAISSLIFIFWTPSIDYRWYMFIPWSIPFLFGELYKRLSIGKQIGLMVVMGILFIAQYFALSNIGHALWLQYNKYPPNSYYLSYEFFWLLLLMLLFNTAFLQKYTTKILTFFSVNSFGLYFIHYLLILIVFYQRLFKLNVWEFSAIVLLGSVAGQLILEKVTPKGKKKDSLVAAKH